tara:strand:- start:44084 stop:44545 length:462 start_codon:yes stop_codon:yes gene_type:complete
MKLHAITIKKGRHYPSLFHWLKGVELTYTEMPVLFRPTEESKYTLDATDQADWNKLYGRLRYRFKGGKLIREEQWHVWRWLPNLNTFQVARYTNIDGLMTWTAIQNVAVGERATLYNSWFSYWLPLSFHFGGADSNGDGLGGTAPNTIKFYIG